VNLLRFIKKIGNVMMQSIGTFQAFSQKQRQMFHVLAKKSGKVQISNVSGVKTAKILFEFLIHQQKINRIIVNDYSIN